MEKFGFHWMFVIVFIIEVYFGIDLSMKRIAFINVCIFSFFAYYFYDWLLTLEIPFHHSIYQSRKMSGSEPFARIENRKNIGSFLAILKPNYFKKQRSLSYLPNVITLLQTGLEYSTG